MLLDPNKKLAFKVVQEGRDGAPLDIQGTNYHRNDTAMLTYAEAKYLIGLSLEPTAETAQLLKGATPIGEHRESGIDVVEETRQFQEPKAHEEDDRSARRPTRSTPAKG